MTKRWLLSGIALVPLLATTIGWWTFGKVHQHCITTASLLLLFYAEEHEGHYPVHKDGFGDALKLVIKEASDVRAFCGPDDDGAYLLGAGNVDEERCSRIYVQGLNHTSPVRIALLFDRRASRGGDHKRSPWGPLLREVLFVDGSMTVILENQWPTFVQKQIELLQKAGISEQEARRLYSMAN